MKKMAVLMVLSIIAVACKKNDSGSPTPPRFDFVSLNVNGENKGLTYNGINVNPVVKITFSQPVNQSSIAQGVSFKTGTAAPVAFSSSLENNNTTLVIQPTAPLAPYTNFKVVVSDALLSEANQKYSGVINLSLTTTFDSTDKFPQITDEQLLTLVQEQTFKYFWDFAHPVSGLARERNTSGDVVTSGGSGFGVMSIIAAIHRQFITRQEGLDQLKK